MKEKLRHLFSRSAPPETFPIRLEDHSVCLRVLAKKGLIPLSYQDIQTRNPEIAKVDVILSDNFDIHPNESGIPPETGHWIPRKIDADLVQLTPCSPLGLPQRDPGYSSDIITIPATEPYFSLVIFPKYTDSLGRRLTLTEFRNEKVTSVTYSEKSFAVSPSGSMIPHSRRLK